MVDVWQKRWSHSYHCWNEIVSQQSRLTIFGAVASVAALFYWEVAYEVYHIRMFRLWLVGRCILKCINRFTKEMIKMKKIAALILALAIVLSLSACGKSKAAKAADELILSIGTVTLDSETAIVKAEEAVAALSNDDKEALENLELLKTSRAEFDKLKAAEQERIEKERVLNLVTTESWFGIYDGDEYQFNKDGSGSHNGVTLEYKIEDGKVYIAEGAAGTTKAELTIDESSSNVKLVIDNSDIYYVQKTAFDSVSEKIRAEYSTELKAHQAWALHNGSRFAMYFIFYDNGNGLALTQTGNFDLKWEFVDNNTLKISVTINKQTQYANYDIVNEGGSFKLVQANNTAVTATPKDNVM